ncbi:hypothetical protein BD311DRAFT_741195 [Dichomitus squalens]|uniref:Hydrophobic surface binding protein A-domain-containing protein n=2 Tax=Dichomitus squalens TaxID=114155 RepID=A0A4Q9PVK7_9APHY|nr:hypothetical protein BD311DRAFT_741195 [Dichomitus squalens]TBU58535.1 hypothetical protein BD310DRAFT_473555 [Dichomitus squalens]
MMSRVVVLLFAFLSLFASSQIYAAPTREIVARQVGDLTCNFDRLSIVAGLATLQGTLKKLSGQVTNDTTAAAGLQTVTDAVSGAEGAIGVIAKALLTGQAAPADARTQVQANLTAAQTALAAINSTDSTISANLDKATTQLANAALAGQGVVANCK